MTKTIFFTKMTNKPAKFLQTPPNKIFREKLVSPTKLREWKIATNCNTFFLLLSYFCFSLEINMNSSFSIVKPKLIINQFLDEFPYSGDSRIRHSKNTLLIYHDLGCQISQESKNVPIWRLLRLPFFAGLLQATWSKTN